MFSVVFLIFIDKVYCFAVLIWHGLSMRFPMVKLEDYYICQTLEYFRKVKVVSITQLINSMNCSAITVRRYLKQWNVITSYNKNSTYYVLPDIPKFDEHGLWQYKTIRFSKYGNLTQTITNLVEHSLTGIDTPVIAKLVGIDPHSILSRIINKKLLQRKKQSGVYVYFSLRQECFEEQLKNRISSESVESTSLPSLAVGIAILVEKIKNPTVNLNTLARRLEKKGTDVTSKTIENFFVYHGILKKTLDSH